MSAFIVVQLDSAGHSAERYDTGREMPTGDIVTTPSKHGAVQYSAAEAEARAATLRLRTRGEWGVEPAPGIAA
jgi:hypothetical protein